MPIYELGYRHWEGERRGWWLSWWPITRTGLVLAFKSKLLKRLLFFSWAPLLYFVPLFFIVGYVTESGTSIGMLTDILQGILGPDVARQLVENPEVARPAIWSLLFYWFFSYVGSFLALVVVAIVGPPLISNDVRTKAFLIYFSKPITRWEYLAGKAGVLLFYLCLITLFPALLLYAVSILFSPTLAAFVHTAWMIVSILLASATVCLPVTLLVLFLSSLVQEYRYAVVLWITICLVGLLFYGFLSNLPAFADKDWVMLTSLRHMELAAIQDIFDPAGNVLRIGDSAEVRAFAEKLRPAHSPVLAFGALAVLSAVSLVGLIRRVSAPMRI